MRPINLTVVHWWPGVVSILKVTRFVSAMRGPLQKPWNNLESDLEICPRSGKLLRSGREMRSCFSNSFHSIVPKPDRTRPDPIRANRRRLYRTGLAGAGLDISGGRNTIGLMIAAQGAALRTEDTVGMIVVIDCKVAMFVALRSPVAHLGLDPKIQLALHRAAVGI